MKNKKGFTLIELLVVIAIIALLLSILMPALRRVKESAKSLVCQTNMKGLASGWHVYTAENDSEMPGSWNYNTANGWGDPWDWAWAPRDKNTNQPVPWSANYQASLDQRQEGVRRGSIWPYVETLDAYHCPSDKSAGGNFRSYSMPDSLNGKYITEGVTDQWHNLTKSSQIKNTAGKYVFIEENDPRGYNINAWVVFPEDDSWSDPMTVWHSSHSNMAFADGHTEEWKWSPETLKFFGENRTFKPYTPTSIEGIEDLRRTQRGWPGQK